MKHFIELIESASKTPLPDKLFHGTTLMSWIAQRQGDGKLHVTSNQSAALGFADEQVESEYNYDTPELHQLMTTMIIVIIPKEVLIANKHWAFEPDEACAENVCENPDATWKDTLERCKMFVIDRFKESDKSKLTVIVDIDKKAHIPNELLSKLPGKVVFKDISSS